MNQKKESIKKYEAVVRKSMEAQLLIKKAADKTSHCLLLQSEDSLLLDILVFIYIKSVINVGGVDLSERLISDNIPDVIALPRGEKFLTEDAEFIVDTAYLTPSELDYKIYVIDNCDTMSEAAQNKLLKLLEEPPSSCRFVLKCASKFSLLPTVRSRSEIIEAQPLRNSDVLETLNFSVKKETRNLIEATGFGRLDYTERVLADDNYLLLESMVFEVLLTLKRSSDMARAVHQIQKFKDYIDTVIFYFECALHDCMMRSINEQERIYFRHKAKEIDVLSKEYVSEVVLELTNSFARAKQRIKGYGNLNAVLDELLFSMLEVKTKWQKL